MSKNKIILCVILSFFVILMVVLLVSNNKKQEKLQNDSKQAISSISGALYDEETRVVLYKR